MLRKYTLEILLAMSIVMLIGQLAWPSAVRWWYLPIPGWTGFDEFDSSRSLAVGCALRLPEQYNADGAVWPLVVFLHGSGDRGNDPTMLQEFTFIGSNNELPVIVAAPQCLPGRRWEPKSVIEFVQHVAAEYRVDRRRIYLVGISMGGYGTWRTAAAYPELFAAIVPICGGGDPEQAESLVKTPIWAFHGANDDIVPLSESKRMIDAVRLAGSTPKFTIFPNAGHGICEIVCRRNDLWKWLLGHRLHPHD